MENVVEIANTAEKVVVKLNKVTLVAGAVGLVVGVGGTFAVKKIRTWRAEKKLVVE